MGITREAIETTLNFLRSRPGTPAVSIVSLRQVYVCLSTPVKRWPGAHRMCGPDGKEWIKKLWRTADVGCGGGNKAKRRVGLAPRVGWMGQVEWVPASEAGGLAAPKREG